jgi:hypothetical protein
VQSSLTGTYCVALANGDANRSYVTEYSINAANTWEYKTITIAGDTAGTWLTDTSIGVSLRFALAAGTTFQTTANNWAGGNFIATANQVNWMSSNTSRTFRISGVQMETGTVATPFELRSHGEELALCQRYYQSLPGNFSGYLLQNDSIFWAIPFAVTMRSTPTVAFSGYTYSPATTNLSATAISSTGFTVNVNSGASGTTTPGRHFATGGLYTATIEL